MTRFFILFFLCCSVLTHAQVLDNEKQQALLQLYTQLKTQEIQDSIWAREIASKGNIKVIEIDKNGSLIGLVGFENNGFPIFYAPDNSNASKTVGTNLVVAGAVNGYGLTGNGMTIGEWDGAAVRSTHDELTGRVTQMDSPSITSNHASHVAGTMIASGVKPNAKGMATAASIEAYDFINDGTEMTAFAPTGIISNHSYGTVTGWREVQSGSWRWYGDTTISGTEDYKFGFYTFRARVWDVIANNAPQYLIVKSAGNDRGDEPPASITSHEIYYSNNWITSTATRAKDGGASGYDCISSNGNAKNILTVGAVSDIVNGYTQASDVVMTSFSGWGPTDDGRIKPDIVANGVSLYSSGGVHDSDYFNSSGTSMSAPNATGSLALLQEMYNDSHSVFMDASTLKALVIHTANEAGPSAGPDYKFGWGLLNIKGAADLIADTIHNRIMEQTLTNGGIDSFTVYASGLQDLEATIVWNDPAGTPLPMSLDPTGAMLVNDLDLRITDSAGVSILPWVLDGATPANAATHADNVKDNVEKVVFIAPAAGLYTISISHKGTMASAQNYGLIISGVDSGSLIIPSASFMPMATTICEGDSVQFIDSSSGQPTAWEWTFTGGTPHSSVLNSPLIYYHTAGSYMVKLKASNTNGSDSIEIMSLITVLDYPVVSTSSLSDACVSGGTVTLLGGSPVGGTWSGLGVVNGIFDPAIAGLGSHFLTYAVSNGTCSSISTEPIMVTSPPIVTFSSLPASICTASAAFALGGGTPTGGTYSGTGVTNNIFDPSVAGVGSHTITYSYTESGGCTQSATITINVVMGTATSLAAFNDLCKNDGVITLSGGAPTGGFYTGPGVDTILGTFDPILSDTGLHTIIYFGPGGLCVSAATATIRVNAVPNVSLAPLGDACVNSNSLILVGGLPLGGTYSGANVLSGVFNPAIAGIGMHKIYYTYSDGNGCSAIDSSDIDVVSIINYGFPDTTVCEGGGVFSLITGTPLGGNYAGVGVVTGTSFDPAAAGPGKHLIIYTDTANSCAVSGTGFITVKATPLITFPIYNPICLTGGLVPLTGATPVGGTYSGIGVSNNLLDPLVNGLGSMTLKYTVTVSGCSNTDSTTLTIGVNSPTIINLDADYCLNDSAVVLIGDPIGGTYSGSGINGNTFNPNSAGVGLHSISYTVTGNCGGVNSYNVMVHPKPNIGAINGPLISSQNAVASYNVASQSGWAFNWIPTGGSLLTHSNNQITVRWDSASTASLQVVLTNQNGCKDSANITIALWPVGIQELQGLDNISIYPNPVTNEFNLVGETNQEGKAELHILNLLGQRILSENKDLKPGKFEWLLNVTSLAKGTYIYQFQVGGAVKSSGRFVKQ